MKIGIAREDRKGENRVVMQPSEIRSLTGKHQVLVEKDAGLGVGIENKLYERAGARIASKKDVYACPLVVKIKEPIESELKLMRPDSAILSMLHLRSRPHLAKLLQKYKINAIAMEGIRDQFGTRMIEALHETGYLGMLKGFELWGKDPSKAVVKVMGYGNIAQGAIQAAARKFAKVMVLNKRDVNEMEKHIPGTDILVDGIYWPYHLRGKVYLVKKNMLKLLKPGAVIVDLVANPAGKSPIETVRPTTLSDISYKVDGVIHTACWGWPGLDPVNISKRYSIQVLTILTKIANKGLNDLPDFIKSAYYEVGK
ncbi:MAG: hypothetical protein KJ732_02210 [Candidatus Margulisbacteria bacterium]|nr:hypothetical protein [Candidatus Margulisiibacteriota bacterium]